jgi:dephospho-CoA kinase
MFIVGLTGGIGSGKTAASDLFAEKGILVVDADVVAREVVMPGQPALNEIALHFGQAIIADDGSLNRAALRQIIFSSPQEKDWLESLLHPLIRQSIKNQLNSATSAYAILVSPLLIETDQKKMVNRVLVIDVPEALQLERTQSRDGNSPEQVQAIINSQISRSERLKWADDIILNNQTRQYLQQEVDKLDKVYRSLASSV